MAKRLFSLVSWNVEHFKDDQKRIERVVDFLAKQKPDVFGLYEVEGKTIFDTIKTLMPGYQFHITEGPQTQEILVGVRSKFTAFFTQKLEFNSGNTFLRPGALLTLTIAGEDYPILFLHTKSSNTPVGLGIRDDQFQRAVKFKETLEKSAKPKGKPVNYIFLGDLNTMGMKYPFGHSIEAQVELQKLDQDIGKVGMRRLEKNAPNSWWNGPKSKLPPSNLDQVVVANNLRLRAFGQAEIDVRGWPRLATESEQGKWIADFSDHALLYVEVQQ